ncbi:MAG: O-antigen ligase family protein [Polyangiales bacterium]|nr:O-antigen ligase family protein [Myxococcales bacterium]
MTSDTRAAPSSLRERRKRTRARRRRRSIEPPPQLWAKVLVGMHVALAPLLIAGAFPWAAATSAASGVALLFAVVISERDRPLPWSPGLLALLGVGAFMALQTLPLPLSMVQVLSPLSADDALHVAAMLGEPAPDWVPLSRDPGRTRLSLMLAINLACTALSLSLLVERHRPRGFMRAIATACVAIVAVSLGHAAVGAETVFGLYTPILSRSFGPIINVNHLSAFAALTTLLCLGLGLQEDSQGRRTLAYVGATMAASLALLTASRGGALSLLLATLMAVYLSRRSGARLSLPLKLGLGALILAAIAGFGLVVIGVREVQGTSDVERLEVWRRSAELALDHWATGAGRGAFEPAFLFRSTFSARYTHPENVLLQYGTELGLPLTVAALLLFGRATWRALRSSQTSAALAAGAVLLLFLHDLFDFSLELSGVAVPAAACAGVAWARAHEARKPASYVWVTAAAAALGLAALIVRLPTDDPEAARARLTDSSLSGADLAELERQIATLHPADGILTGLLGHRYAERGSPRAGRWLNRSMYLAPEWGDPHGLAALWLVRMGRPEQALMEVREADRRRAGLGTRALCEILGTTVDPEVIRRASVDPDDIHPTIERARRCTNDAGFRAGLDALAVAHGTDDYAAHQRLLLAEARANPAAALAAAETLRAAHPDDPGAVGVWLDILILADPSAALAERGREGIGEATLWRLADVASTSGDRAALDEIVAGLRRAAAGQSRAIAVIDGRHGRLLIQLGATEDGVALLRESMALDPDGPGAQELLRVAVRDHRLGLGRAAAQHICRQQGRDSLPCRTAERQVDRLAESTPGVAPAPR